MFLKFWASEHFNLIFTIKYIIRIELNMGSLDPSRYKFQNDDDRHCIGLTTKFVR